MRDVQTREAGDGIKPGVGAQRNPRGSQEKGTRARDSGRQSQSRAGDVKDENDSNETAVARSTGWKFDVRLGPGVPLRSTPGFTLTPAPQAGDGLINDLDLLY